jgi:hypothetical protein
MNAPAATAAACCGHSASAGHQTVAAPAAAPQLQASGEGFRWPVRGRVISSFGEKSNGTTNDGINIAVPEGTSVRAAENGVVIYSGSELEGFGNLVLVRHANEWVTAYAHNSELMVNRGDTILAWPGDCACGQDGQCVFAAVALSSCARAQNQSIRSSISTPCRLYLELKRPTQSPCKRLNVLPRHAP